MKELYLEVFSDVSADGICFVPLETVITLFIYEFCDEPQFLVTLVISPDPAQRFNFKIKLPNLLFEIVDVNDVEIPAGLFKLPVLVSDHGIICVSGLCCVLRQIIKTIDDKHSLLGFKQNCLNSCATTSVWTRFCEIDIIETVNELFFKSDWQGNVEFPKSLARFEIHMSKPVKVHNIQKQKQDIAKREGITCHRGLPDSRLNTIKELDHTYSEGHKISLADLIIFPCYHLIIQLLGKASFSRYLSHTTNWYENLTADNKINKSIKFLIKVEKIDKDVDYLVPNVPDISLYEREWKSSKGNKHIFTKQDIIDNILARTKDIAKEETEICTRSFGYDVNFQWSSVPFLIQLGGSDFPEERLLRKTQQLENMVKAVLKIAEEGDRIVDFCSGSGYLGLILAHCLPLCTIIILENKEESLKRAYNKAVAAYISNVIFCQGNIDYFKGNFDIGMSLHSCGSATDLVIKKCINKKASFVCCPCCYGSIQSNHIIQYPISKAFRDSTLTKMDYLTLAHSSDQTHDENNIKTSQGKKCMNLIDTDRLLDAKENGFMVYLSTMEPSSCSPKNNLLVGIHKEREYTLFR